YFFFFQAEDGIRDFHVTGVQTCALPIFAEAMGTDQMLRGAALVGHQVLVPSARVALGESGGSDGAVAAPDAGSVQFTVTDANGRSEERRVGKESKTRGAAYE